MTWTTESFLDARLCLDMMAYMCPALYILPNMPNTVAHRMAAVIAPLGMILARGQPGACRGPRGGSLRLRQHLHLHALPGAHLHLLGFTHPPLPPHLHLAGTGALRRGLFSPASLASMPSLHAPHPPAVSSRDPWTPPDSWAALIARATSSSDTAGFRPWLPRALRPFRPSARYRAVQVRRLRASTMNRPAICACVMSLRSFARSITSARTAQTRIRYGLYRLSFMALTRSACGAVSLPMPPVDARGFRRGGQQKLTNRPTKRITNA